jgi:hypothetical protein
LDSFSRKSLPGIHRSACLSGQAGWSGGCFDWFDLGVSVGFEGVTPQKESGRLVDICFRRFAFVGVSLCAEFRFHLRKLVAILF